MLASPSLFRPHTKVFNGGDSVPFFWASVAMALAMLPPASGPRPLLARKRCSRGRCEERNLMSGAWAVEPKALSLRLTVWRFG